MGAVTVPGPDPKPHKTGGPLLEHQEVFEQLERLDKDVVAVGYELTPARLCPLVRVGARFEQTEVSGPCVAPDEESTAVVVNVILVSGLAAYEWARRVVGAVRIENVILRGQCLVSANQHVPLGATLANTARERLVALFIDQLVPRHVVAETMTIDLV